MQIKKSANIARRLAEMPPDLKNLVNSLLKMPENELPEHIDAFCSGWNRPRGDLCHWIPVLNHMDTILEKLVKKYGLDQEEISPKLFSPEDERLVTSILNFSTFLLDKSSNRGVYNSEAYVNNLTLSISPEVTSAALKLSGRLAERNVHSRGSRNILQHFDILRLLKFAVCVTSRTGDSSSSADDTILSYLNNTDVPSGFSLQYYNSDSQSTTKSSNTSKSLQPTPVEPTHSHGSTHHKTNKISSSSSLKSKPQASRAPINREGLTEYTISTKDAVERPLDLVIADAFKVVPKNYWLDVVIKAQIAKSTANTEEGARLRSLMIQMQCNALTVISTAIVNVNENIYESKIMNDHPNLIKQLAEILVPENPFDIHVRNAAIDSFCALCCQPAAVPEITINLSSNVSYGTLMHVMRNILKDTRSGKKLDDEYYFFTDGMISLSTQLMMTMQPNAAASTTGGGMVPLFWELVKEEKAGPRLRSNALDGLMRIISEYIPGYLNTFLQQENGGQILMKILEETVESALDPSQSGSPPTLCAVDYSVNYHTIQWLKVILHFIVSITSQARTAERIQQVLDSSFLTFAPKIISNPKAFGFRIISLTLGIIGSLLENESSTFGIMTENQSIDKILAEIPNLLEFSSGLHGPVAKFLSSIAHNETGLSLIKEKDIFNEYFKLISKNLGEKDSLKHLGICLDQICTEHSSLRPIVIREAIKLIDIIIGKLNTHDSHLQFFYELDTTSEGLEEDIPLAKRYFFLTSTIYFIEHLLKNHFSRVEFIKQRGVERILDIFESPALSFDFAFNGPATSLNKTVKQLFDLDIDTSYIIDALLSKMASIVDKAEAKAKLLKSLTGNEMEEDFIDFIKSLGPVENILQCFLFTVFTNYGTGYRISDVLKAIAGEKNEKKNETDSSSFDYKDLIHRIGALHLHITWESARVRNFISLEVSDATMSLPYDPVLNSYFRSYQDSSEYKKLKEAEAKLPEDYVRSEKYRIIKASRFVLSSSSTLINESLGTISFFLSSILPSPASDKSAYKLLDTITKSYCDQFSLYKERQSYGAISAWFACFALRSLKDVLMANNSSNGTTFKLLLGSLIFFKQNGGIMLLSDIAQSLFNEPLISDTNSGYSMAFIQIILHFSMMINWKPGHLVDTERAWGTSDFDFPNYFNPHLFFLEVSLTIFDCVSKIWESDSLEDKPYFITIPIILLLSNLLHTANETYPMEGHRAAPHYISWREAPPSETMYKTIMENFCIDEADNEHISEFMAAALNHVSDVAMEFDLNADELFAKLREAKFDNGDGILTVPRKKDGSLLMYPSDLKEMCEKIQKNAVDKVLGIIRVHPKTVYAACNFIDQIITSSNRSKPNKSSPPQVKTSAIKELILMIISIDPSSDEDEKPLANFCHLLGILLFDTNVLFACLPDLLELIDNFVNLVETPDAVKRDWFPYVLLILETIFLVKEIPDAVDKIQYLPRSVAGMTDVIPKTDALPKEIYKRVFNILITVDTYKDELTVVSISRLLVFFTRDHECASLLVQSPVFPKLLQQMKRFSTPPKEDEVENKLLVPHNPRFFKSMKEHFRITLLFILRNAVETPEIVKNIMVTDIKNGIMRHRSQLELFFQSKIMYAARSPQIFLEVLAENCVITDLNNLQKTQFITLQEVVDTAYTKLEKSYDELSVTLDKAIAENESLGITTSFSDSKTSNETNDLESDVSMGEAEHFITPKPTSETTSDDKALKPTSSNIPGISSTSAFKSLTLENPSGVINILLHELFSIGRENLFTVSVKTPEALQAWIKDHPKPEKSKENKKSSDNPYFHYACFLLQAIAELVSSYSVCKLEFINFSKKPLNASSTSLNSTTSGSTIAPGPVPFKPRHTALNFFLQELIPIGVLESSSCVPYYEWSTISSFANLCILTLISATDEKYSESVDETQGEPTLQFVRKFTFDTLAKAFRDASQSANDTLLWRYSKIYALADLCNRMFSSGPDRNIVSSNFSPHTVPIEDGLAICKVAFDKDLQTVMTNSLAEIDLNYPHCRKPLKLLVKCLNKLARLVIDVFDDGSAPEKPEEEDLFASFGDISSDSEVEDEMPAIFRNSALSMYEAGDDLSDDGDEIIVDESDHESQIEEEMEEMDYIDDDAQSDVGSDASGVHDDDDEMFDEDMDDSDDDLGSGADEHENIDDEEIIVDDGDRRVELLVGHNHNHNHNHDNYNDDDDVLVLNELTMNDANSDAHIADSNERTPFVSNNSTNNNTTNHTGRGRRAESEEAPGSGYDNDSGWESFEEGDESDDEIERLETLIQQRDFTGLDDNDGSWVEEGPMDDVDLDDIFDSHDRPIPFSGESDSQFNQHFRMLRQRNGLNFLFGGNSAGFLNSRHPQNDISFHIPIFGNLDSLRAEADIFSNNDNNKNLEILAKRTIFRWGEAANLFWFFDKTSIVYRYLGHFINSVGDTSIKKYADLNSLKTKIKEKEEKITLAYREKAKHEQEVKEAKEREERERKEREEREELERIQREERERAEREERERQLTSSTDDKMETSSVDMKDASEEDDEAEGSSNQTGETSGERYMMEIGGHEVDISGLGIDHTFLEAIPADMREEVLTQHLRGMQESASEGDTRVGELVSTFLNALPSNVRRELMNEEATEPPVALSNASVDTFDRATFFASLDPEFRRTILIEQDDETLDSLPPELAAEGRMFRTQGFSRPEVPANFPLSENPNTQNIFRHLFSDQNSHFSNRILSTNIFNSSRPSIDEKKAKKKTISAASQNLIDKQGVAALLRTLYLPQTHFFDTLNELLFNLCTENKANRLDIINTVLHILLDASIDKATLDRGFLQTSNRARYAQTTSKPGTPTGTGTPGRVPIGYNVLAQEITPSTVAKQALEVLEFISHKGGPVRYFFVSEHDVPLTRRPNRKGKGRLKDRELAKEHKYPINILITLLGRPAIYENPITLEQLTVVLVEITKVVPILLRTVEDDKKATDSGKKESVEPALASIINDNVESSSTTGQEISTEHKSPQKSSKSEGTESKEANTTKPHRVHEPPYIPEKNYKLISSTLVLKECSSRTFEQMLTVMKNLSSINGVKKLFAKELVNLAVSFGPRIIESLGYLNKAVEETKPGDEVPGPILAPFSSGSSDQARLLRALAALDYLLDHSKEKEKNSSNMDIDLADDDYINTVYKNMNFGPLWAALSESLTLIQKNSSLLYVATALLPLIESLMVICKHSAVKKISVRESNATGTNTQFTPSSKIDISNAPLETLFFIFTDQHRKILNQLVRANTKLMNGSFSILVKNPKSLEFDNKRRYFTKRLYDNSSIFSSPLNLNVQRDTAFLDSYRTLHFRSAEEIKHARLVIKFKGEEGVDAGGLTREWYQVMSRQMFNPDYALFQPVASDRTTFHPNRTSSINDNHLYYFKFIGRIIGKAICDNKLLDCHFSRAMYKRILGKHVSLKDMENLDPDYYKSLVWMLENDITDIITETFSIEADDYGETNIIDLKPDGRNIPVTEENKAEYVRLVCEYRLIESVSEQLNHFLEGFHDIIPKDIVSIFDEQELELLISGLPDIDIDDWRNNTEYQNYSPSSPQIKWFWRAVRSMDPEERAKLLQFVTGTSKVPLNGFKELVGMHGVSKFSIHRAFGSKDRLPSSHTCFNQIDLPMYDSYENLREALLKAITEGSDSFEFA